MLIKFTRNILLNGIYRGAGEIHDVPEKAAKEAVALKKGVAFSEEDGKGIREKLKEESDRSLIAPEEGKKGVGKK